MIIKTRAVGDILPSEITSEAIYLKRRKFIRTASTGFIGGALAGALGMPASLAAVDSDKDKNKPASLQSLDYSKAKNASNGFFTDEALTPESDVISYNNFYEFGTDKSDPKKHAHKLTVKPWSVSVEGEAEITGKFNLEDILEGQALEERIYRLRCVEAWSMVIPWVGFPLGSLLKKFKPTSKAKYVAFETLQRPSEMQGQRSVFASLDWPYREGLRIDEAMHPLTILAVGLYGKELPNQNGAPLRLVVPWKYGFKSIKSIVSIRFTEQQPVTSWNISAPGEYGFYSNVNPQVSHPRWSQATERRLPTSLFKPTRIKTQMFNGYAEQVASLYSNMDLRKFY